jgi:hypothetical protein
MLQSAHTATRHREPAGLVDEGFYSYARSAFMVTTLLKHITHRVVMQWMQQLQPKRSHAHLPSLPDHHEGHDRSQLLHHLGLHTQVHTAAALRANLATRLRAMSIPPGPSPSPYRLAICIKLPQQRQCPISCDPFRRKVRLARAPFLSSAAT